MKHKISISIDEDTLLRVKATLRQREFRNKSHLFELAVTKYLEDFSRDENG